MTNTISPYEQQQMLFQAKACTCNSVFVCKKSVTACFSNVLPVWPTVQDGRTRPAPGWYSYLLEILLLLMSRFFRGLFPCTSSSSRMPLLRASTKPSEKRFSARTTSFSAHSGEARLRAMSTPKSSLSWTIESVENNMKQWERTVRQCRTKPSQTITHGTNYFN